MKNKNVGKYYGDQLHWNDKFDEKNALIKYIQKYDKEADQYRIIYYHGTDDTEPIKTKWEELSVIESEYHEIIKEFGKWRYVQPRRSAGN